MRRAIELDAIDERVDMEMADETTDPGDDHDGTAAHASGSPATGSLREITLASLSHELNTRFLSLLLYVSVSISVPTASALPSHRALADSGATINLIDKLVVSLLRLTVEPHPGLLATLADGKTVLSCSGYVSLSCTIAGVSYSGIFMSSDHSSIIIPS